MAICIYCGKEYDIKADNNRYSGCCSAECRSKYMRNIISRNHVRKCVWCGKEFRPISGRHQYCSAECKKAAYAQQRKELKQETSNIGHCKRKKSCYYGGYMAGGMTCDYLLVEGHSRGCPPEECTYYKPKARGRRHKITVVKSRKAVNNSAES